MNRIWDKIYSDDQSFFGEESSKFALTCHEDFVKYNVKKVLELSCGQGRDSIFCFKRIRSSCY